MPSEKRVAFVDQKALDSYVSMIMVNLPFPPLPVIGVSGDSEECIMSGHDLLSRAIACTLVGPQNVSVDVSTQVGERKKALLSNMHEMVAEIWRDSSLCEKERLERCYQQFCAVFRAYMRLYPGPDDIRIYPMAHVDAASVLCSQAVRHLQARLMMSESTQGDADVQAALPVPEAAAILHPGMRYRDIIKAYVCDLHQAGL